MKYLFWNTHGNENINPVLSDLIIENGISFVILAEHSADIDNLIEILRVNGVSMHEIPTMRCDRLHILGDTKLCIEPNLQTDKASILLINGKLIICGVHLISRIYADHEERREMEIEQIVSDINKIENEYNTKNTVVVGDFNINPYDKSCISARYFHSLPVFVETERETREVEGRECQMFYNPMWNFLGDFKEPFGTYYKNTGNTVNPLWNIFDQVIIRPTLRKYFVDESLKIITNTLSTSFLDKNKHPNHSISDHLPITFEIKEERDD